MTNAELVAEISSSVIHPREDTDVNDMLKALDEYLKAIPGQNNDLPTFEKIAGRDSLVVMQLANAIWYRGYVPAPLTDEDRDYFHPEREPWLDKMPHFRDDYLVYLEFLEKAIDHLSAKGGEKVERKS